MFEFIFLALGVLALSLAIAGFLMAREKALLGVILGVLPIPLMVVVTRWSIHRNIERCIAEACASSAQSPECNFAQFGCTEWPGMGIALITIAGWVDLVLYIVGVIVIAVVQSRRRDY